MLLLPEFRLLYALLLTGGSFVAGYRLARRWSDDAVQRLLDAMLLGFLVQYLSVALPGMLHLLHPLSMALTAALLCGGMVVLSPSKPLPALPLVPGSNRMALITTAAFAMAFIALLIAAQALLPVAATDALTYHVPAAVQWLRTGRLGLLPTPFFNPANTYSPLAGSTFIAWLLAPAGNEILARWVQVPPLLMVFLAMVRLGRSLGAATPLAAVLAAAAILSRPLLSEAVLAKDDIFLAAFFITVVSGLSDDALSRPAGPWRIGIALGLALATKYTSLMTLPLLAVAIDAPFRARWRARQWAICLGCVFLLAGPWYLRNWVLSGNPLYPVAVRLFGATLFKGLFVTHRAPLLGAFRTTRQVLFDGYFSIPYLLAGLLAAGWAAGAVGAYRALRQNPVARICIVGSVLGIVLFLTTSPYAQVRFLIPSLLLMFGAALLAPGCLRIAAAVALMIVAVSTCYKATAVVERLAAVAAGVAGIAAGIECAARRIPRAWPLTALVAGLALAAWVYIDWMAYVDTCRSQVIPFFAQDVSYPRQAGAWGFVREKVPEDAVLAYANTHLVYPLYGYELRRRAMYVPARHGMETYFDHPRIDRPVADEEINVATIAILNSDSDSDAWLRRLRASGAGWLYIDKTDMAGLATVPPPELKMARDMPGTFVPAFEDADGVVYRIEWTRPLTKP